MSSYLQIQSFLGKEKAMELSGGWIPFSFKDKVKNIKKRLKNQSLLSIDQKEGAGNDPSFGERRTNSINQLQNSPKTISKDLRRNIDVPRTIRAREKSKQIGTDLTQKGK
ncbi:hypothetical protein O181_006610 [Austropuccinia psidii MF-1]|uniref:Uncharacterized protein n=1 Tax=Austropuccinia psidii MF-1 TaxID=1389203 RepID=A0A9Q3BKR6_9BASI|nr:hypothetical protein [Austropuccinia psidii MF-1]